MNQHHTAIYEAGHVVIGRVLGMVCGGATIKQDSDSAGHAIIASPYASLEAWLDHGKFRENTTAFLGKVLSSMAGGAISRLTRTTPERFRTRQRAIRSAAVISRHTH